jgi:hypothetical protein
MTEVDVDQRVGTLVMEVLHIALATIGQCVRRSALRTAFQSRVHPLMAEE